METEAHELLGPEDRTTDELSPVQEAEVARNDRGLPLKAVLRGVFARFLPGSLLSMAGLLGAISLFGGPTFVVFIMGVVLPSLCLAIGYGIGLESLRRWLFGDAGVDGRRSLVAGFVSPLAFFSWVVVFVPGSSGISALPLGVAALILIGILMAAVMFFPWLTSTEASPSDEEHVEETGRGIAKPY